MHPLAAVAPSLLLAATAAAADLAVLEEVLGARATMQDAAAPGPAASSSEGWSFRLSPYLWIPAQSGTLNLGFRARSTDCTTGSGADRFEYDVVMYGPYVAFTLEF